eukprot:TRINITY_DN1216_c0_g1_i5.p3 TRINITY_DN1216_c0_g1~~TRINITY_DN1216_c0_g1_i5.p3  ORF type:complete len:174 (-),score=33.19 TRINITY_DN1216_c0_g1_i5:2-523(-)
MALYRLNLSGEQAALELVVQTSAIHSSWVRALSWNEAGSVLLSGSDDHTAKLVSYPELVVLQSIAAASAVNCAKWGPQDSCILIGTEGGTVSIWSATGQQCLREFQVPSGAVYALALPAAQRADKLGRTPLREWCLQAIVRSSAPSLRDAALRGALPQHVCDEIAARKHRIES